jgi:adenylate cyclase
VKNIARPVSAYKIILSPPTSTESEFSTSSSSAISSPSSRTLSLPDKPSIAVLPFANLSGDPEQEYFSSGITEDLITDLSKLSGLFVISRNSVFLYKGKAIKPEQVSQELGVRYVLEGSVRKVGSRVRISAQLVDAANGYHLWAERYDRELQDIFAVQDEVTRKIVAALQITLTEGEQKRSRRPPTNNLEAYEHLLRGLEYYWHRTKEMNAQARRMFERAIELDPNFAMAHAWLGRTYVVEWMFQWDEDSRTTMERVFALAQRAVALDDSLPVAHQTLAYVFLLRRQFDQAIVEAERAVALDPNDADAWITLGEMLSCAGRPQEAVGLVEKAMRLNPHYPSSYLFALGQACFLAGRYEEAILAFRRLLTRNPGHLHGCIVLALAYNEAGRREEARMALAACGPIDRSYSLARVKERIPYRDSTLIDRWLATLRQL